MSGGLAASAAAATAAAAPDAARALRDALGHYATGVALVTTRAADGRAVGLTINSFASLSLAPPLVLWSLVRCSPSLAAFSACRHFAIQVLGAGQRALAARFADPRQADKFAGVAWHDGPQGLPLVDGALADFICAAHQQHDGGDHVLFIGRVEQHAQRPGAALLFHRGRFETLAAA